MAPFLVNLARGRDRDRMRDFLAQDCLVALAHSLSGLLDSLFAHANGGSGLGVSSCRCVPNDEFAELLQQRSFAVGNKFVLQFLQCAIEQSGCPPAIEEPFRGLEMSRLKSIPLFRLLRLARNTRRTSSALLRSLPV